MEAPGNAAALVRALLAPLEAHAPAEALAWLRGGMPQPGKPLPRGELFGFYAGAGRRLRGPAPALAPAERDALIAAGVAHPEAFTLADLARAALLVAACAATPEAEHVTIATEAFRKGDNGERIALLRSLPLLPGPERFVPLAVEACRTHVVDVFAAIACDNPFPARYFPELNFNQLAIKTLFLDLPLPRVHDWRARVNAELVRMARDTAAERRAAGRVVSADLALLCTAKESP
jgi:hypothetical protein